MPDQQDDRWLDRAIILAVRRRMCFGLSCTTCGGGPFQKSLANRLTARLGKQVLPLHLTRDESIELARGLAGVVPATVLEDRAGQAEALRFILYRMLWQKFGDEAFRRDVLPEFAGSFAHAVFAGMEGHAEASRDRRQAFAEREAERARLGQERRAERAVRHAERMAAQAEYNRQWRERRRLRDEGDA